MTRLYGIMVYEKGGIEGLIMEGVGEFERRHPGRRATHAQVNECYADKGVSVEGVEVEFVRSVLPHTAFVGEAIDK